MKSKLFLLAALAAAVLGGGLIFPQPSAGQAQAGLSPLDALIMEVAAQQTVIVENQAKIDEKVAAIAEDIRIARIYVSRGGGRGK